MSDLLHYFQVVFKAVITMLEYVTALLAFLRISLMACLC